MKEAIENYEKGVELDPANAQCKQMLEQAEMQMAQQAFGGMGGGMPGMGGGMPGMGGGMPGQSPFSAEALEKLKTNPKITMHLQDPQFKNLYDMCIAQPNMLMQLMQMDPRFMDVIQELTGIDLGALGKQQQ